MCVAAVLYPLGATAASNLITIVGPGSDKQSSGVKVDQGRLRVGGRNVLLLNKQASACPDDNEFQVVTTPYSDIRIFVANISTGSITFSARVETPEGSPAGELVTRDQLNPGESYNGVHSVPGDRLKVNLNSCPTGPAWQVVVYGHTP